MVKATNTMSKDNYKECSILRSHQGDSYLIVIGCDHLCFFVSWKGHSPVPVAHISNESKLPAPETLWGGRLGILTFVYVSVDTTETGLIQS